MAPLCVPQEMKVRSALRKMCAGCRIVKRGKKVLVVCKENPKHKQRQGLATVAYDAARAAAAGGSLGSPSLAQLTSSVFGLAMDGDGAVALDGDDDEDGGT